MQSKARDYECMYKICAIENDIKLLKYNIKKYCTFISPARIRVDSDKKTAFSISDQGGSPALP